MCGNSTGVIRVVWGSATGPTAVAAYDGALAAANVHNYNLLSVSSVIPADATLEVVGTAPELGVVGDRLTVVQSRVTVPPGEDGSAAAGIGWSRAASGRGIFYEAAGDGREDVVNRIGTGLAAGRELRDWDWDRNREANGEREGETDRPAADDTVVRSVGGSDGAFATAVVCAVYGEGRPVV
jgi:arginine decarboxylase